MKNIVNNITTQTIIKPYTVHIFNPDLIRRDEKTLDKVMCFSNQPVIITEVHQYWNDIRYTVIPVYNPADCEFMVYATELWSGKPMKLGKRNNYHLCSNDTDQFNEDELREICADNYDDREPTEDELYHVACNEVEVILSDFFGEIERYENTHGKSEYIVLADIGRWDGRYDGGKIIVGMNEVISQCTSGLDEYEIFFKNGQLCITGYHHDGHNSYVIRELKNGSADYIINHECDTEPRCLHRYLFNSSRWSMRVKMFDILGYGGGIL